MLQKWGYWVVMVSIIIVWPDRIQAQNDTLLFSFLDSIVVTGYDSEQRLKSVPGAIHVLNRDRLISFDQERLLTSVNSLPGVRFEERSPGSYRLAIRGSMLRSPFGVRNIKVYWNGIPFTDPTGSTALNLLDNINMQHLEVIKGPAGSVYGAGTGGVINISSRAPDDHFSGLRGGVQGGSYGYAKIDLQMGFQSGDNRTSFKIGRQASEGYRENTNFERWVGEFSGEYKLNSRHFVESHLLYSALDYKIPGGLTRQQYEDNPAMARPSSMFALGSVEAEAGVRQHLLMGGLTHRYIRNQFQNTTTLYGSFSPFDHPFNLDYKRDLRTDFGGRTRLDYYFAATEDRLKATLGAEYQSGFNVARNFTNDYGKPGTLNFDDELASDQFLLFGRMEYNFSDSTFLTVGISRNFLKYDINRLVDTQLDTAFRVVKTFDPVWIPRVGFSHSWPGFGWHASVSMGYSPPTIEDVRTNEGSINLGLKPEIGINYEVGVRGRFWRNRLSYDWSAYYFNLSNTIVQQSTPRGTVVFENSGSTNQYGMETVLEGHFQNFPAPSHSLRMNLSHSLNLYYFDQYETLSDGEQKDFSGNQLTGVPRNTLNIGVQWDWKDHLYFNGVIQAVGEIPLNDANTVYADAYQDVSIKAGYRFTIANQLRSDVFVGIRNVLDQKYSLGNDLNAFGGRYFQAAPPRNYYVGWRFQL